MQPLSSHRQIPEYQSVYNGDSSSEESSSEKSESSSIDDVREVRKAAYERSKSEKVEIFPGTQAPPTPLAKRAVNISQTQTEDRSSLVRQIDLLRREKINLETDNQRLDATVTNLAALVTQQNQTIMDRDNQIADMEIVTQRRIAEAVRAATNNADEQYFNAGNQRAREKKWFHIFEGMTIGSACVAVLSFVVAVAAIGFQIYKAVAR
jgi:uncharacterized protein (DUF3084 family)